MSRLIVIYLLLSLAWMPLWSEKSPAKADSFDELVRVYRDSVANFQPDECYYDFYEVVLEKWGESQTNLVIMPEAVAAVIAYDKLDGAYSEGVAFWLNEIFKANPSQIDVLYSLLNLDNSDEYKSVGRQLADLFFYEALRDELYKDNFQSRAEEYIEAVNRSYPQFKSFAEKTGLKIELIDGCLYVDGNDYEDPKLIR